MNKPTTFIVPGHLAQYNTPLSTFAATKPEFNYFVVGAYIFSTSHQPNTNPLALLLQRSFSDSYGGYWENPGGSVEPTDKTLLEGVAREVLEETGLHISKFLDLVCVDQWVSVKPDRVRKVAKFSFITEVYEAADEGWMDRVVLDDQEHQAIMWATEEQVREGVEKGGALKFVNEQGKNLLRAFELWRESR
ncbi:NUDIX domain protein [Aspergillus sclerotialis]|uniref:NUDIX domain protein n=1 Tax=Aspergillus sclerotialis TaxID=2070753 RepID=A0A3A2ZNX8_9EURO|nr:NUDIX domain protein [Aspergillus sclerotialis]